MKISKTQQDYLKTIWTLEQAQLPAKMSVVAENIGVKPPTVLSMFRQLARLSLIQYDRKGGAVLTRLGQREAERLVRKHRLIETFLNNVLKIDEPFLHEEAEILEHVISDRLIMKIDAFLSYPRLDPHGSVIPPLDSDEIQFNLDLIEEGIPFKVRQIPVSGAEKKYCSSRDFLPGSVWEIREVCPDRISYLISNGKNYLALSRRLAQKIKVTVLRKHGK